MKETGKAIQQALLEDFNLSDLFCDANDLEKCWNSIKIPEPMLTFFAALCNFAPSQFHCMDPVDSDSECDNDCEEETNNEINSSILSESKKRKIIALYQIMYFIVHNGKRRTPLHILNAESIHHACRNSVLISSFHYFGLALGYDELLMYHNDMASYMVYASGSHVPLPSYFDKDDHTMGMFDNFDHEEDTESGKGGSHDTVFVLAQENNSKSLHKPKISETDVIHGMKHFQEELPCQQLKEFSKVNKKIELPENYTICDNLYTLPVDVFEQIKAKDLAWAISRLDLSQLDDSIVHNVCEKQDIPSWSAFNSLVSDENLPQQRVGFLPVLPYPATEYSTIYTSLTLFEDVLFQLKQNNIAVTCDEGVYKIAKEIQLQHPHKFNNIVLCLGSFHIIKIIEGCIGKYLEGSGAVPIWTDNEIFGTNIVKQVLCGKHYKRSLTCLFMLAESIERLQLVEFFQMQGTEKYRVELGTLAELNTSVQETNRQLSKSHLSEFIASSSILMTEFNKCKQIKESSLRHFNIGTMLF